MYYDNLSADIVQFNKSNRYNNLQNATNTYNTRYRHLIDIRYNHVIYDNYLPEELRKIIARWRLSSHRLRIETGRQEVPFLQRNLRTCSNCKVIEDEQHAIFHCTVNIYEIMLRLSEFLILITEMMHYY